MTTLREILEGYTVDELQVMLKLANTRCSGIKSAVIEGLLHHVFDQNLKNTWNLLSSVEKLAVAEAIYNHDGWILAEQIESKYGQKLSFGSGYISRYSSAKTPTIFLFNFKRFPIPEELIKKLKVFVPEPEKNKISYLAEPSTQNPRIKGSAGVLLPYNAQKTVLHDLLSVLGLIRHETLKVSPKTHMPTSALITKINKVLMEPDYYAENREKSKSIRGFAWIVLLKTAQFIRYKGDVIELTRAGEALLVKPTVDHIKQIFCAFLRHAEFDDIVRIDTVSNMRSKYDSTVLTDPTERRQKITAALKDCDYGKWISLSEFCRHMRAEHPRYEVASYLGELKIGNNAPLAHLSSQWPYLEATYIKYFLMEILATLGMVDIRYHQAIFDDLDEAAWWDIDFISTYDGLYEFSITALGAYCLGLTQEVPHVEENKEKLFHVMPNLEITTVVDQLFKSDVLLLDMCTDKVNEKTWKLSQAKLLNVIEDKNCFLPEFKAFLYSHALSAIPKTVEHFFEDIERRTDQVAFVEESKTYFCKDKVLAKLIANDTKTKSYCLLAGDHHLVVPLKSDKIFKTALKKVGYITKLVS